MFVTGDAQASLAHVGSEAGMAEFTYTDMKSGSYQRLLQPQVLDPVGRSRRG